MFQWSNPQTINPVDSETEQQNTEGGAFNRVCRFLFCHQGSLKDHPTTGPSRLESYSDVPRLIAPGPNLPRSSSTAFANRVRFSSVRSNRSL